jgi:spermidine synthase
VQAASISSKRARSAQDIAPAVTLSEEGGVRYLHFGSPWIQGAMKLSNKNSLVLEYQRHMMAWLLFLHAPNDLLQLGLGAGALTKFCLRRLPTTQVEAVEISREVSWFAQTAFALDADHPRLTLTHGDAKAHLKRRRQNGVGVLQVDLYDWTANGPVYESREFYSLCRRTLSTCGGMLVVNLFGEHASFGRNLEQIYTVFNGRVLCLAAHEASNVVVLAFSGPMLQITWDALDARAAWLAKRFGLPAQDWVATIRANQPRSLRASAYFSL